jgi:adenylate cyclase
MPPASRSCHFGSTGRCLVGNLGSDLRFNYSVLGDPVNVASRLEGQTKLYGVPILIGAKTGERAKDKFAMLEIDLVTVKGKTHRQHNACSLVISREKRGVHQSGRTVASAIGRCGRRAVGC